MKASKDEKYISLKNVVVAVEPPVNDGTPMLNRFAEAIESYQSANILPSVSIVSLIHSSMYMVPTSWYTENRSKYATEAKLKVHEACKEKFEYKTINILKSKSSANHILVENLSDFLTDAHSDLLVVLSSNKTGVPYWLLGSFAETAALTCVKSVMVIKPQNNVNLSVKPRMTVAIDANAKYSAKDVHWLAALSLKGKVQLDLIFVQYKPSGLRSILSKSETTGSEKQQAEKFMQDSNKAGVETTLTIAKEESSVAETIIQFADRKKAWGIITISTERSMTRNLLLGSTARKVLTLTHRPFITVRTR